MGYITTKHNSTIRHDEVPLSRELNAIFSVMPIERLLRRFSRPRDRRGPKGYSVRTLLYVFLAGYHLRHTSIADTVRQLGDNPTLAAICGLSPGQIPSRATLSRFFSRMSEMRDEFKWLVLRMSDSLRSHVPEFAEDLAIDATDVPSYCNAKREPVSDPEGSWAIKNDARSISGKRWNWGYKWHMMVCVRTEIPVYAYLTTAGVSESHHLVPLLSAAKNELDWFAPKTVAADKAYDATSNYEAISRQFNALPIIPIRALRQGAKKRNPNTEARTDHPRNSAEWKRLYSRRTSVERTFSRLKETRRLRDHCYRGLAKVELHCLLAVLTLQAKALVQAKEGRPIREAVRKVA